MVSSVRAWTGLVLAFAVSAEADLYHVWSQYGDFQKMVRHISCSVVAFGEALGWESMS